MKRHQDLRNYRADTKALLSGILIISGLAAGGRAVAQISPTADPDRGRTYFQQCLRHLPYHQFWGPGTRSL